MAQNPYYEQVSQAGSEFGVDPRLAESVLLSESGGDPHATSPTGAQGLMQIEPGTAAGLARDLHIQHPNSYDPMENIRMGVYYLSQLLRGFHGNKEEAVAGYNAGAGAVQKYHGIPPYKETQNYVKTVMGRYKGMGGEAGGPAPMEVAGLPWGEMKPEQRKQMLMSSLKHEDATTETFFDGLEKSLKAVAPWAKAW